MTPVLQEYWLFDFPPKGNSASEVIEILDGISGTFISINGTNCQIPLVDCCSGFILLSLSVKKVCFPLLLDFIMLLADMPACILNSPLRSGRILQHTQSGSI